MRALAWVALFCVALQAAAETPAAKYARLYFESIDRRLDVPSEEAQAYARMLDGALAGTAQQTRQFVVLVDRSDKVQAGLVFLGTRDQGWTLIGASPVSTGLPGAFDHFETPLGVFEHSTANPDFRAVGTRNRNGIRGYGSAGMRVYDFGWVITRRSWGDRKPGEMRLQMHATDRDLLEPLLGTRRSKGCIRIPASMNAFIDHHGLLDADYDRLVESGKRLWVLRPDREPTPWAGRYLVVVETQRVARPSWSHAPRMRPSTAGQAVHAAVC